MKVELLYFARCPTYRTAGEALKEVLSEEGMAAEVDLVAVNTYEEAERVGFPGSPTVRVTAETCSRFRNGKATRSGAEPTLPRRV